MDDGQFAGGDREELERFRSQQERQTDALEAIRPILLVLLLVGLCVLLFFIFASGSSKF